MIAIPAGFAQIIDQTGRAVQDPPIWEPLNSWATALPGGTKASEAPPGLRGLQEAARTGNGLV